MEKRLNVNIDINVAREMLIIAGFSQAVHCSDEEIFNMVLDRISCYGATCTVQQDVKGDTE